jgi:mRNA deadenylase 3'-5' endonuclease subunit Ccr4
VDFPTRKTKDSGTAIDNIFIDFSRLNSFQVFPFINGLSDNEAQYLCINNIFKCQSGINTLVKKRLITKSGVPTFIELLKIESWDTGILGNKINCMYLL